MHRLLDLSILAVVAIALSAIASSTLESALLADALPQDPIPLRQSATSPPSSLSDVRLAALLGFTRSEAASASPLPFQLLGTLDATSPLYSAALIRDPDGSTRTLHIGDSLSDALVLDIQRADVLLLRGGHTEHLRFGAPVPAESPPNPANPTPISVPRSRIAAAIQNPAVTATQAFFAPAFAPGSPPGFSISRIKPGSIFSSLGLRDGDVLLRVDGIPTTRFDLLLVRLPTVTQVHSVTLEFLRDGAPIRQTYELQGS